jgi:hypothetical protein
LINISTTVSSGGFQGAPSLLVSFWRRRKRRRKGQIGDGAVGNNVHDFISAFVY